LRDKRLHAIIILVLLWGALPSASAAKTTRYAFRSTYLFENRGAEPLALSDDDATIVLFETNEWQAVTIRNSTHGVAREYTDIDGNSLAVMDFPAEIPAGGITAVVGPSGAGKTTLVDLITGLCVPQRGVVAIDGVPLPELDLRRWREMIGYVPQETLLLNDSVRRNVTLGDPSLSDADVERVLREAAAQRGQLLENRRAIVGALPVGRLLGLAFRALLGLVLALHGIDDDANKQVEHRERGDQNERQEEHPGVGEYLHDRTDDPHGPAFQRHHLKQGVGR